MMKFNWGKIPLNPEFDPEREEWTNIREPSPWLAQLIGFPLGVLMAVLLGTVWVRFTPLDAVVGNIGFSTMGWVLVIVIIHELIHAVLHPENGASADSTLGFWPSRLVFYAHYDGVLTKHRFLAIAIGPFIILSLVPLVIGVAFQYASRAMFGLSTLNALIASVDLLYFLLITVRVPSGAILQNRGWKTYYRMIECS
jgi:hypothetical protein